MSRGRFNLKLKLNVYILKQLGVLNKVINLQLYNTLVICKKFLHVLHHIKNPHQDFHNIQVNTRN